MFAEALKVTGSLVIEVFGEDGQLKDRREVNNLVVTAGKQLIAERMLAAPSKAAISHAAVGSGTTAPAASDTTLQTELGRSAIATATRSTNTTTYTATIAAGVGTGTLAEAGLFNSNAGGDMLARTTFTPVAKGGSDTMSITWNVTIN